MKGQSAIEFISVYGFMLIIAALFIALVILFAFSAQNSIQTSQCNGFSGLYCSSAQVVYNAIARNSLILIALNSEQSAPVNIIGINVIVDNATYSGTCTPSVAAPAERVDCIAGVNAIKRMGQQIVGSYTINGQYCNSPLYNVSVQACAYQNVTYTGFFSTYVTNHLSLGYSAPVAANVVGAITGFSGPASISVAPSGAYAYVTETYSGSQGEIVVMSTSTNTITGSTTSNLAYPYDVSIAPSGTYAYVTNMNFGGSAYIEAISTATKTGLYQISTGSEQYATISPSGTYAYLSNYANVLVLNTATRQVTGSINSPAFSEAGSIAFSPNGAYAYVANTGANNVLIINTATGTVAGAINSIALTYITAVAVSPDGSYVYVTSGNNEVFIANTTTDKVVSTLTSGFSSPTGVAFAPDGSYVYVVNSNSNNVVIINPGTYK